MLVEPVNYCEVNPAIIIAIGVSVILLCLKDNRVYLCGSDGIFIDE